MKAGIKLLRLTVVTAACTLSLTAQDFEVTSIGESGAITWEHVPIGSTCRVEWASSPSGPWFEDWRHLSSISTTTDTTVASVPMCYRVVCSLDLENGLVAHFPFDGNTLDATGNGHDGSVSGPISYVPTTNGKALSVQGTGWVTLPDQRFMDGFSEATVTMWVNSQATNGLRTAVASSDFRSGFDPISIQFDFPRGGFFSCGYMNTFESNAIAIDRELDYTFQTNRWYLLSMVLSANATNSILKFYADGDLIATGLSDSEFLIRYDRNMSTCIGCVPPVLPSGGFCWIGMLDDVRFYSRPLYQAEIRALHSAGH